MGAKISSYFSQSLFYGDTVYHFSFLANWPMFKNGNLINRKFNLEILSMSGKSQMSRRGLIVG